MSQKKRRLTRLVLTERAIADLLAIESYATKKWGTQTATRYLADIESCLELIQENPGLLGTFDGLPEPLQFYSVRKHLLICDACPTSLVVLTVIYGSMDIPNRLAELAPTLATEVAMLHEQLTPSRTRAQG